MNGITAGELRLTGGPGFSRILDFSMREYPGEHSRAELTGAMEASEGGTSGFPWLATNSPVEIHVDGMERASGRCIMESSRKRSPGKRTDTACSVWSCAAGASSWI